MNVLRNLSLMARFSVSIAIFILGFFLYGAWSFHTLDSLKVNGPLYDEIVQGKDLIADVLPPPEYVIESYLVTLQLAASTQAAERAALLQRLGSLKKEYDVRHEFWLTRKLSPEIAELLLKTSYAPALTLYETAFKDLAPALEGNDEVLAKSAMTRIAQSYAVHRAAIDRIVDLTTSGNTANEAAAVARIKQDRITLLAILLLSLAAGVSAAVVVIRGVRKQIGGEPHIAVEAAQRIARGDLSGTVGHLE